MQIFSVKLGRYFPEEYAFTHLLNSLYGYNHKLRPPTMLLFVMVYGDDDHYRINCREKPGPGKLMHTVQANVDGGY